MDYIDRKWRIIFYAYLVYAVLVVYGGISGEKELTIIGSAVFLLIMLAYVRIKIIKESVVILAIILTVIPLIAILLSGGVIDYGYLFKYVAVFLLFVVVAGSELTSIQNSKYRYYFLFLVMFIIALSLFLPVEDALEDRSSGVFANPNNLALMSFALLFFLNKNDPLYVKILIHFIVITVLVKTGTSGAILGYGFGMLYYYTIGGEYKSMRRRRLFVILLGILFMIMIYMSFSLNLIKYPERLRSQYEIINNEALYAWSGGDINYGYLKNVYGYESLSGLWRISYWRSGLDVIENSSLPVILFGSGLGASKMILGMPPHNDYLRFAIEVGLIGFVVYVLFLYGIIKMVDKSLKYVIYAFVVYSFSENNFDNYLFMSLFILFVASNCYKNKSVNDFRLGSNFLIKKGRVCEI